MSKPTMPSSDGDETRPAAGLVVGVGTDIVKVERIQRMLEKHEEMFWERVFTPREQEYCRQHKLACERAAGRWAAKEAVLKALGTGWAHGIKWTDVEIYNQPGGRPVVRLSGRAHEIAEQLHITEVLISISHCRQYAVAFATAIR